MNNKPETITTRNGKTVKIIPATKSLHPEKDGVTPIYQKKRVAAYCRVSTSQEEQQGSYALQKSYFEKLIANNPDWELVKIYGDEGKSGTSLKGRAGFLEMMDDVRAGKIDHIIAKATSRFGRNNAEFIKILDELEYYGVEVNFESEGILTSGTQTRMMLQMLGAANEHYSNTLSNNVRWSKERNMREGKVNICYGNFLGYKKGADGEPEIVPEEAETVKLIFSLFLNGMSYTSIATHLNSLGIVTKKNKPWMGMAVKRVVTNEKYTGDVLLQKTFKKSYLDKQCHKNNGEKPQVLVKNNHEPIIDRDTFAKAKELIEERSTRNNRGTAKSPFVGKVICNECGGKFGHKTWNSRGNIKYSTWVCRNKYTEETAYGGKKCKTPNLREEWLVSGYLYAINEFLAGKGEYLAKYERKLARLEQKLEPRKLEQAIRAEDQKIKEIEEARIAFEREWEFTYGKSSEYSLRQEAFKAEMIKAMAEKKRLEEEQNNLRARKAELERFIKTIKSLPAQLTKFDAKTFIQTIDYVTVKPTLLIYNFYGGEHIRVSLEDIK
ncbi:recombinase family protein [Candidatus Saccharibacteria bacterium]|nr:recombinase family protein [Candidatus Saccharibacteria bacterium]